MKPIRTKRALTAQLTVLLALHASTACVTTAEDLSEDEEAGGHSGGQLPGEFLPGDFLPASGGTDSGFVDSTSGGQPGADSGGSGSVIVDPDDEEDDVIEEPGEPVFPDGRGASVTFTTYEAEGLSTNGQILAKTRTPETVSSEASGRSAVRLSSQGQFVEFTATKPTNSVVVRYSIPDGGHDYWTTLTVLVDGVERRKLTVTSRYSWTYGDESQFNKPAQENPASGHPHHFFDETRALIGDVAQGQTIRIQKSAGDNAGHYDIDLIETEQVAPPRSKPDGFISVTDCGATANDNTDDSQAILQCIALAKQNGVGLYIPAGEFRSLSKTASVPGITIAGAGMWHSTVSGFFSRFDCYQPGCSYRDFAVFGDTVQRDDASPESAFSGNGSSGVTLDRIWVEHTKVGYWTGINTNGLTIKNSRFRNLMADAVNFDNGATNSVVEQCHIRNTGDDALAMWSHSPGVVNTGNTFRHNYVQIPWKANCFGIYGGQNNVIEDNVCVDTVQYPGVLLARQFGSHAFAGTTHIRRNTFIRAGGFSYGSAHGAIKLHAAEGELRHLSFSQIDIYSPTYFAIHVQGPQQIDTVYFDDVLVDSPGTSVFYQGYGSKGAMDASNVSAVNSPASVIDDANGAFHILRGTGNSGW